MTETIGHGFHAIDWLALLGYFIVLVITGVLFTKRQQSTDDYFRASGGIPVLAAGISFLATSLSAATFVGGPQQSYAGNLTYLSSNIGSIIAILIVAIFFVPAFYKNNVSSIYSLLRERFGETSTIAASSAFMIGRVFASGARLYIAALPASLILFGDIAIRHQLFAIAALTIVGIVYTYSGGIRTVIWTDVIQTCIFVGAAIVVIYMLFKAIPLNLSEIIWILQHPDKMPNNMPSALESIIYYKNNAPSKLSTVPLGLDGIGPKHTYTLLTSIFGFSLLSLGAYGTDQDMAQRLLTLKNSIRGSWSAITGILVGLPVTTLFMIIGLMLFIFYNRPDLMGQFAPHYEIEGSRKIFLTYILRETPPGITGLMMAGLFAAGLSSLNSAINAMSSSFVNDLYKRFKSGRSESHYLKVGRTGALIFGIILGLFAVFSVYWQEARPGATLIDFALMVMVFAYSGLVAVFLTALFTKRGNNASVIAALLAGFFAVLFMQMFFAKILAFPWQMFIAAGIAFGVCLLGKMRH